ncbi:hypothetical protein Cgig2_013813 [Carnegiea gigantea]|uniref:Uncharacterized protein n=1 Tax=Carnegiea gigantea TaxID=171969 RepID=A0A9Q1GPA7_9CARY|nr:hypothetical protein Cgig2_013813 [Carnegiea gigantea]
MAYIWMSLDLVQAAIKLGGGGSILWFDFRSLELDKGFCALKRNLEMCVMLVKLLGHHRKRMSSNTGSAASLSPPPAALWLRRRWTLSVPTKQKKKGEGKRHTHQKLGGGVARVTRIFFGPLIPSSAVHTRRSIQPPKKKLRKCHPRRRVRPRAAASVARRSRGTPHQTRFRPIYTVGVSVRIGKAWVKGRGWFQRAVVEGRFLHHMGSILGHGGHEKTTTRRRPRTGGARCSPTMAPEAPRNSERREAERLGQERDKKGRDAERGERVLEQPSQMRVRD